jgi:hypothetical protein
MKFINNGQNKAYRQLLLRHLRVVLDLLEIKENK